MEYVKINNVEYPATISGLMKDADWDNRESKSITLQMTYQNAVNIFVDGLSWSIVCKNQYENEQGEIVEASDEFDNSDFNVAGTITDNRNGTMTVKMGKQTDLEDLLEIMYGDLM